MTRRSYLFFEFTFELLLIYLLLVAIAISSHSNLLDTQIAGDSSPNYFTATNHPATRITAYLPHFPLTSHHVLHFIHLTSFAHPVIHSTLCLHFSKKVILSLSITNTLSVRRNWLLFTFLQVRLRFESSTITATLSRH